MTAILIILAILAVFGGGLYVGVRFGPTILKWIGKGKHVAEDIKKDIHEN